MRHLLLFVLLMAAAVWPVNYYVSKTGTYAAAGTIGDPTVLRKANENMVAGDTCFVISDSR